MPELRELLEALAEEGQPRGADEVLRRARARVASQDSTARPARRHGWLVAAAAIVTVFAAASSVLLLRQRGDDVSRPRAVGNVGRIGKWEVVPFPRTGFEPGTQVQAIARNGRGLVAVGSVSAASGLPVQAAWTSPDGRRWQRSSGATFSAGVIELVAKSGDGLIAVGSAMDGPDSRTVWRSGDGRRWQRLTDDAPAGIRSVVASGPGLVAAGFTAAGDTSVVTRAAIWTSAKGKRWSPVPDSKRLFPAGHIAGLALDRDGVIAVGTDQSLSRESAAGRTAVWSSQDGTHWNRIQGRAGLQHATVTGAAPIANREGDLRILATRLSARTPPSPPTTTSTPSTDTTGEASVRICVQAGGRNAVWGSERGRHWDRISKIGAAPGASQLVGAGEWWLAGGMRGTCEATRSVVYISSNGRQWTTAKAGRKASRSISSVYAMSSTADGAVVVVGHLDAAASAGSGPDVWMWTAPAER